MVGTFGDGNGGGDFGLIGAGRLYGVSTYTGPTDAFGLGLYENSRLPNSSIYRVTGLFLFNNVIAHNDRLNDNAELQLRRSLLLVSGNPSTPVRENIGTLRTRAGTSELHIGGTAS